MQPRGHDVTLSELARMIDVDPQSLSRTATRRGWPSYKKPNGWRYFPPESQAQAIEHYRKARASLDRRVTMRAQQKPEVVQARIAYLEANPDVRVTLWALIQRGLDVIDERIREARRARAS